MLLVCRPSRLRSLGISGPTRLLCLGCPLFLGLWDWDRSCADRICPARAHLYTGSRRRRTARRAIAQRAVVAHHAIVAHHAAACGAPSQLRSSQRMHIGLSPDRGSVVLLMCSIFSLSLSQCTNARQLAILGLPLDTRVRRAPLDDPAEPHHVRLLVSYQPICERTFKFARGGLPRWDGRTLDTT